MNSLLTSREVEDVAGVGSFWSTLARMVTPPRAVRQTISNEFQKLVGSARVTIPTDAGPISIDPSNPADVAKLKQMVQGIKLTVGQRSSDETPLDQISARVRDTVPGGWLGLALGALAGVLVWQALRGGARSSRRRPDRW